MLVREEERVAVLERVGVAVDEGEGVPVSEPVGEAPCEIVAVALGVAEGEGSATPWMKMGAGYTAAIIEFHGCPEKLPAVALVRTSVTLSCEGLLNKRGAASGKRSAVPEIARRTMA